MDRSSSRGGPVKHVTDLDQVGPIRREEVPMPRNLGTAHTWPPVPKPDDDPPTPPEND
ncbi:hypothetical protein GCM10010515_72000 [Streptomyces fructofermentans]|uniref:Uncharacterized protein n=1 Tax=Streptomyces fructofermentans TaxID=152141 RepID=A0A918NTH7_9ACTN|nr:hypothetical protein GCM10010515_72000 [Streptomyces fructofermentans]